jgi:thioredoxin-like negative regulator of GroEL
LTDVSAAELERALVAEERLVLVEFWQPRCEPCRELRRELEPLDEGVCLTLAVNADAEPEAAARYAVSAFPTLVFFKHGQELRRFKGGALPASTLARLRDS